MFKLSINLKSHNGCLSFGLLFAVTRLTCPGTFVAIPCYNRNLDQKDEIMNLVLKIVPKMSYRIHKALSSGVQFILRSGQTFYVTILLKRTDWIQIWINQLFNWLYANFLHFFLSIYFTNHFNIKNNKNIFFTVFCRFLTKHYILVNWWVTPFPTRVSIDTEE